MQFNKERFIVDFDAETNTFVLNDKINNYVVILDKEALEELILLYHICFSE